MTTETKVISGIGFITLVILVIGVFILSRNPNPSAPPEITESQETILVRENSFQTAKDSGRMVVAEFADFQCPACAAAFPILQEIKKQYADRINFVYRHYPLPQHKNAIVAAVAAESAGSQGKFWEMHDLLYINQAKWENEGNPQSMFTEYAKQIGLDEAKFKSDYEAKFNSDKIMADVGDGNALGVNSTPTFFINGKKYPSVMDLAEFKQLLDQELGEVSPASPSASPQ